MRGPTFPCGVPHTEQPRATVQNPRKGNATKVVWTEDFQKACGSPRDFKPRPRAVGPKLLPFFKCLVVLLLLVFSPLETSKAKLLSDAKRETPNFVRSSRVGWALSFPFLQECSGGGSGAGKKTCFPMSLRLQSVTARSMQGTFKTALAGGGNLNPRRLQDKTNQKQILGAGFNLI